MPAARPVIERLMEKRRIDPATGCWLYTGRTEKGYGRISVGRRMIRCHRVAWEHFRGPIPEGLEPDHLCRNRACFNPDHLEVVDHATNVLRGEGPPAQNARKTHCSCGHPLVPVAGRRARHCPPCVKAYKREWHQRNRHRMNARSLERYYANHAEQRAKRKAYYEANRDEINAKRRRARGG